MGGLPLGGPRPRGPTFLSFPTLPGLLGSRGQDLWALAASEPNPAQFYARSALELEVSWVYKHDSGLTATDLGSKAVALAALHFWNDGP